MKKEKKTVNKKIKMALHFVVKFAEFEADFVSTEA